MSDGDVTATTDIDIVNHDVLEAGLDAIIDPVEDIAGDLDANLDIASDLLNASDTDNSAGDSDVDVGTDIEVVDTQIIGGDTDVHVDAVEQITGDLDIDADLATDVLGETADPLVNSGAGGSGEDTVLSEIGDGLTDIAETVVPGLNAGDGAEEDLSVDTGVEVLDESLVDSDLGSVLDPVEEIIGDIDSELGLNTDILNSDGTDNGSGDSDLTADIDLDLAGNDVIDQPLDVTLDPVEQLTGDLDVNIDTAIDLLNSDSTESGDGTELGDDASWTESTITDGGGLFGDIINGTDGLGDALPDPAGTVAEGIGVLDVDPELDVGSIGGLFG